MGDRLENTLTDTSGKTKLPNFVWNFFSGRTRSDVWKHVPDCIVDNDSFTSVNSLHLLVLYDVWVSVVNFISKYILADWPDDCCRGRSSLLSVMSGVFKTAIAAFVLLIRYMSFSCCTFFKSVDSINFCWASSMAFRFFWIASDPTQTPRRESSCRAWKKYPN